MANGHQNSHKHCAIGDPTYGIDLMLQRAYKSAAEDFAANGLITEEEKDKIVSDAAKSSCNKRRGRGED